MSEKLCNISRRRHLPGRPGPPSTFRLSIKALHDLDFQGHGKKQALPIFPYPGGNLHWEASLILAVMHLPYELR